MSVVNDDKQCCIPLVTSTISNVNNKNDFVNNSNNRMCGQVIANLDCAINHQAQKTL